MDSLPFLIFVATMMFLIGVVGSNLYHHQRIKNYKALIYWYQKHYPNITHPSRRHHKKPWHGVA